MRGAVIRTLFVGSLVRVACLASEAPSLPSDGRTWWEHVTVLADDAMAGRETGSPGLRAAQTYVIDQFLQAGLEPAGTDGFLQPVAFVQRAIDEAASAAALVHGPQVESIELGADAYFGLWVRSLPEGVDAPLVFAGNGLRVPEVGHDDFAGLDTQGKIVVTLGGTPATVSTALASHYRSTGERAKLWRELGIAGNIVVPNPSTMDIPWVRMTANRTAPALDLATPAAGEDGGSRVVLVWNPARADKLFAGSGHTFRELALLARDRQPLPTFPLAVGLRARPAMQETSRECANVVARLPGADPVLRDEHVVLSAHLDHLGVGAAIDGDPIYNGAMDNAAGVAALLELAAAVRARREPLRRSLLFVLVTAEEEGLLGSQSFARHPTVPATSLVANVNVDMFLPIIGLTKLRVLGLEESDLGDLARRVAAEFGVEAMADPEPLRNLFIRSDQYPFIQQGIPAVKLDFGYTLDSPEHELVKEWTKQRYHAPSDDLAQPVDLAAAARYADLLLAYVTHVANADARPQWKPESFFRRYVPRAPASAPEPE